MSSYTGKGQPSLGGPATALWATKRPVWLVAPVTSGDRAAAQPGTGRAGPDRGREHWDRVVAKRRYEYKPLDDAVYHARFRSMCVRYHPAVAAILAHDVSSGHGCYNTRAKRRG